MGRLIGAVRQAARALKAQVLVVYFAARDPSAPLALRALALFVAAYALSPIDLIPDFIPVLGLLDDLLIVPLGLWLLLRWMPADVIARARLRAVATTHWPRSRWAAVGVVGVWLAGSALCAWWIYAQWRY